MSTMPNMPARLTNPLGIILVVMLLLVIRVQAALRWRTLSALSALMPCPASPNRCACSNAQSIIRGTGQPRCEQGYCQWLVRRDNGSTATIWLPEHQQEDATVQIWVWQSWLAVRMESE